MAKEKQTKLELHPDVVRIFRELRILTKVKKAIMAHCNDLKANWEEYDSDGSRNKIIGERFNNKIKSINDLKDPRAVIMDGINWSKTENPKYWYGLYNMIFGVNN